MIFLLIVPHNHCRSFLRFHCSVCFLERVQVTNFFFRALLLCSCVCVSALHHLEHGSHPLCYG